MAKRDTIGFELVGLKASIRGIVASGRGITSATKLEMKVGMNLIAQDARSSMSSRSGGGGYPRDAGDAIRVKAATLELNTGSHPYAFGAEFGARRAWIFGEVTTAKSINFAQFAPFGGSGFALRGRVAGYHIGPAIVKWEPLLTAQLNKSINEMLVKDQRKRGVNSRLVAI